MDLRRVLPVRLDLSSLADDPFRLNLLTPCSDLEDPRPVIASLFGSSTTSSLPTHILALYVHNGVKIYASWLSALSTAWDESVLEQIRSISSALESQLDECARSSDIELQERGAEFAGLLEMVRKGLDAPRPLVESSSSSSAGGGEGGGFEEQNEHEGGGFASSSRAAPTSLTLLDSLFFSHELNPVNPKAQGMVTAPAGLDFDTPINASSSVWNDGLDVSEDEATDEFGRPLRRERKVEEDGGKKKRSKKGALGEGKKGKKRAEEPEELERVRLLSFFLFPTFTFSEY